MKLIMSPSIALMGMLCSVVNTASAGPKKDVTQALAVAPQRAITTQDFLEIVERHMNFDVATIEASMEGREAYHQLREKGHSERAAHFLYEKQNLETFVAMPTPSFLRAWPTHKEFLGNFLGRVAGMLNSFIKAVYEVEGRTVPRDIMRERYPSKIHPYVAYLQKTLFTPFFEKLLKVGIIRDQSHDILPICDGEYLGFVKDARGQYLPFSGNSKGRFDLQPIGYGLENVERQTAFLVRDDQIIKTKGFVVDQRPLAPEWLRIQGYYGEDSAMPFTLHPLTVNITDGAGAFYHHLRRMLSAEAPRGEDCLFIPLPEATEDAAYVEHLVLEELQTAAQAGEGEALGLLEMLNLASVEEEAGTAAQAELSVLSEPKPISSVSALLEQSSQRLLDDIIAEEQRKISAAVAAGQVKGRQKASHSKRRSHRDVKKPVSVVDSAPVQADPREALRARAQEILRERLVGTRLKYRSLLALLTAGKRDFLRAAHEAGLRAPQDARVMTDGSHLVRHDSLGAFTLVRAHGGDRLIPLQRAQGILARLLQGIRADLEKAAGL